MERGTIEKLKYVAAVFLPATATLVGTVGMAIDFQQTTLVITLISAGSTYIGMLIGQEPPRAPHDKKENKE